MQTNQLVKDLIAESQKETIVRKVEMARAKFSLPARLNLEIQGSIQFVNKIKAIVQEVGALNKDESIIVSACLESVCEKFNLYQINNSVESFIATEQAIVSCEKITEQLNGLYNRV